MLRKRQHVLLHSKQGHYFLPWESSIWFHSKESLYKNKMFFPLQFHTSPSLEKPGGELSKTTFKQVRFTGEIWGVALLWMVVSSVAETRGYFLHPPGPRTMQCECFSLMAQGTDHHGNGSEPLTLTLTISMISLLVWNPEKKEIIIVILLEASKIVWKRIYDVFPGIERQVSGSSRRLPDFTESGKGRSASPRIILGNACPGIHLWWHAWRWTIILWPNPYFSFSAGQITGKMRQR